MSWIVNNNGEYVWHGEGPPPGSGENNTGFDPDPAKTLWRGGSRSEQWTPQQFLQTYGNYTGLFPSLGQQVGQALYGSVQGQKSAPNWQQYMLPQRQNNIRDMSKYSPFQSGIRTMSNPFPLNGMNLSETRNIGMVNNAGNPFIGAYSGLTGFPGNGPNQPGTQGQQPPPPAQPPPQQPVGYPPYEPPPNPVQQPRPPITSPIYEPPPGSGGGGIGGTPFTGGGTYPLPTGGQQPYGGLPTGGTNPFGTPYNPQPVQPSPYAPPQPMNTMGGQPMGGLPGGLSNLSPQMISSIMNFLGSAR